MKKLSARESLIVYLGILVVICFLLTEFVGKPLYRKQVRMDQEIENKIEFIGQYYSILSQKEYYLKKEEVNQTLKTDLDQRFLSQETSSLAGADMQRILQVLAKSNSVHIVQVNTEKSKSTVGLLTVPVRIIVRSSLRNLAGFLQNVENHKKFFVIEDIQTRRFNKKEPEHLESRLLINGFMKELVPEKNKRT